MALRPEPAVALPASDSFDYEDL